ncbi:P-loop NTPase fold protein [Paracoccaceae bacterium]|nr:P-loop NTPase fold protein [Paracoccaceae bacterium]
MTTITFSDEPIDKISDDQLNYKKYSMGLAKFVSECETPLTVGLQGQWGTGKTSLMKLLKSELQSREIATSWVNTWEYSLFNGARETTPQILLGMVSELKDNHGDELKTTIDSTRDQFFNIKTMFGSLIGQIVNNQLGADFEKAKEDAKLSIRKTEISKIKAEISNLIQTIVESGNNRFKRVVFFVDDLDRINPTDAVEVLEALKNVFDIKNCVFILAIDYEVVVKGLRNKFGERDGTNEREFRSFFDKIIQVPFTMPALTSDSSQLIEEALKKLKIRQNQQDYKDLLKASVGNNPRSLKRFLNTYSLTRSFLSSRSEQVDLSLAILTAMQISYPKMYAEFLDELDVRSWTYEKLLAASETIDFAEEERLSEQLDFEDADLQKFNEIKFLSLLRALYDQKIIDKENFIRIIETAAITSVNSTARKEVGIDEFIRFRCYGNADKEKWTRELYALVEKDDILRVKATQSQLSFKQDAKLNSAYLSVSKSSARLTFPIASKPEISQKHWEKFHDQIHGFSHNIGLELKAEIRPYKQSWHLSCFINTEVVEPRKMLQLVKFGSQLHVDKMQK